MGPVLSGEKLPELIKPSIRRRPARPVPVEAAPAERPAPAPRVWTLSERRLSPSSPNTFPILP